MHVIWKKSLVFEQLKIVYYTQRFVVESLAKYLIRVGNVGSVDAKKWNIIHASLFFSTKFYFERIIFSKSFIYFSETFFLLAP